MLGHIITERHILTDGEAFDKLFELIENATYVFVTVDRENWRIDLWLQEGSWVSPNFHRCSLDLIQLQATSESDPRAKAILDASNRRSEWLEILKPKLEADAETA